MNKRLKNINQSVVADTNTVIIGTGAAAYACAYYLKKSGMTDFIIICENRKSGTSRNTGSDKQTYYKIDLSGNSNDSPNKMANDLLEGHCIDGDTALIEAANSIKCFMTLCDLGVEFPTDEFGRYVGYRTDHDLTERATSAGPLTSKQMTECLENAVLPTTKILDNYLAIEIIKYNNSVCGLLCLDLSNLDKKPFAVIKCNNIVMSTGGPAGIYADTVYPNSHHGFSSLAYNCGALGQNLTEWQYGLASINPKWNVSGTYMQVLPRFISVDKDGKEHEFLLDFFSDKYQALSYVFRKGYEWPFDSKKAKDGSSIIDLLVYNETVLKKRRVFLDFRSNPFDIKNICFNKLENQAFNYLNNANACFGTPFDRLEKMNHPAIELYKSKGIDLQKEMLEIALCAQHNNGGVSVDNWWQTCINGLFVTGEAAGTHGISRPGGTALNAGQVGSLRAAQYIATNPRNNIEYSEFEKQANIVLLKNENLCNNVFSTDSNVKEKIEFARVEMSKNACAIRVPKKIKENILKLQKEISSFDKNIKINDYKDIKNLYLLSDIYTTQLIYLEAMDYYINSGGISRGGYIYVNDNQSFEKLIDYPEDDGAYNEYIQESWIENGSINNNFRKPRPLPTQKKQFEVVWQEYRKRNNIH